MSLVPCIGCGAPFPALDGPVHEYMESSPGCWHAFGQVLAREYGDPRLSAVHRLTVDSYAAQHPGGDSRQAIQSVGLHLARLCLFLECGITPGQADAAMRRINRGKSAMHKLERPARLGSVTVADVLAASDAKQHLEAVNRWAEAVWKAWALHHATVRRWAGVA